MSGTWPSSPRPASVRLTSWEPALLSSAQSMKRIVRSRGGQRWMVRLKYGALSRDEWAPIDAFAQNQAGQYEKFTLVLPGVAEAGRGTMAGAPLADGAHAAGVRTVNVKGMTPAAALVWRSGDVIKFANHLKVYRVVGDVNADGAGKAAITILPALIAALANNEAITYANVPMQCALANDQHGVEYSGGLLARQGIEYELIEDPYV